MKFEVAPIPSKGLGLRAVQDIKRGELVLKEKHVGRDLGTVLEERKVPASLLALIVTGQKKDSATRLINHVVVGEITANNKPALMELHDPCPEGPANKKMARIYLCNQFANGLFLTCSRMNHSCKPAVQMSSEDDVETEVRALRDIKADEEITVSYIRASDLGTKAERAEKLRSRTGGFECHCEICALTKEEQQINDRFRTEVKAVMQKTEGFFDGLFVAGQIRPKAFSGLRLMQLYLSVQMSLNILHGSEAQMEGEAETAVLTILLDLALLAEVANTQIWRTELGHAMPTPGAFLNKAKEKAGQLGTMFVSNCTDREVEMEMTREAGSEMELGHMPATFRTQTGREGFCR
jgi:hypothetical protein